VRNIGLSIKPAFVMLLSCCLFAQSAPKSERQSEPGTETSADVAASELPDAPTQQSPAAQSSTAPSGDQKPPATPVKDTAPANQGAPENKRQPKRILGLMPNFRAVSAGAMAAPPSAKQAFVIATQNSFDYSSFIFVGITSAVAEWSDAHPQLGEGMAGYGRYYWRGFADKTDGNYLVIFALPTVFHQDERYYALGKGSFWKRLTYSGTRVFVTPNYDGKNSFNVSELLGRGIAQGISLSYYPSKTRTASAISEKYAYAIGRDALTNIFREFWPDIAEHALHRQP
jgi:hypothetical protein